MKLVILQSILAPYRIPLFANIARTPGVELLLLLSARSEKRRQWNIDYDKLPFRYEWVPGATLGVNYEREIQISYGLWGALARFRPDAIVCSGFSFQTAVSVAYKAASGAKLVIWNEGYRHRRRWLRRGLVRWADACLAAGSLSRRNLVGLGVPPERIHTAYNCVDVDFFAAKAQRYRGERSPGDGHAPVVLFVGYFVERKGVWDLVRAFESVQARLPEARLELVGDGPLKPTLMDYCSMRQLKVSFPGYVQQENIAAHYARASVFALASHRDNSPLVLVEALACGVPIVVSDAVGSMPDLVEPGCNGYSFRCGDAAGLSERLVEILADESLQTRLAQGARLSSEKYRVEVTARAFLKPILRLTNHSPSG
jgi:glycosyltransferase involved in cell wall biosynthesis